MPIVVSKTVIKPATAEAIMRIQSDIENRTPFKELSMLPESYTGPLKVRLLSSCEEDGDGKFKVEIEFETPNVWPFELMKAFEKGGYGVVAHMYDCGGFSAFVYACNEAFQVPNWIAYTEMLREADKQKSI